MIVYRLSKLKYAHDLSGIGAERAGGRWNSRGVPMIYTAGSQALCVLEVAVHLPLGLVPNDYCMVEIAIPDDALTEELTVDALPIDWQTLPHPPSTQQVGNRFVQANQSLVLKVPSAVVPAEHNYLLAPRHTQMRGVEILKVSLFEWDSRLFHRPS